MAGHRDTRTAQQGRGNELSRFPPQPNLFLILADVPGVTVRHLTDVTGQANVALRFPFTGGITEILLNARTYLFAGYVRDGVETVITKEAPVAGAGSSTPWIIHPR